MKKHLFFNKIKTQDELIELIQNEITDSTVIKRGQYVEVSKYNIKIKLIFKQNYLIAKGSDLNVFSTIIILVILFIIFSFLGSLNDFNDKIDPAIVLISYIGAGLIFAFMYYLLSKKRKKLLKSLMDEVFEIFKKKQGQSMIYTQNKKTSIKVPVIEDKISINNTTTSDSPTTIINNPKILPETLNVKFEDSKTDYLISLIPKLKHFSVSLDNQSLLIDQSWIMIGENEKYQKLIFKNNKDLIMSSKGIVSIGKWEYISQAKTLLLDRNTDKVLINPVFIEKGILVFKYDGVDNASFTLVNENILPASNIDKYLLELLSSKFIIQTLKLSTGDTVDFLKHTAKEPTGAIGQYVLINSSPSVSGYFVSPSSGVKYYISNGVIERKSEVLNINTQESMLLEIECFFNIKRGVYGKGDKVKINNEIAPDGLYKINLSESIEVRNGAIQEKFDKSSTSIIDKSLENNKTALKQTNDKKREDTIVVNKEEINAPLIMVKLEQESNNFTLQLKELIDKEKKRNIFMINTCPDIIDYIKANCKSKQDCLSLIETYESLFKSNLIETLKKLSNNYKLRKELLSTFIEFNIVEQSEPYNLLNITNM